MHAPLQRLNASSGALSKAACSGSERLCVGSQPTRATQHRKRLFGWPITAGVQDVSALVQSSHLACLPFLSQVPAARHQPRLRMCDSTQGSVRRLKARACSARCSLRGSARVLCSGPSLVVKEAVSKVACPALPLTYHRHWCFALALCIVALHRQPVQRHI